MRPKAKMFAVLKQHGGIIGLTELARPFDNGVQHWLNVRRRGGDDVQNITAPGLVSQCFGEVARLRLHLLEQPHILDGDHRLVGEGLQQLDVMR